MDILRVEAPDHVQGALGILLDVRNKVGLRARVGQAQGVGQGKGHVVDPEVREEFRIGMVGVTVPLIARIDPHLREPLAGHEEIFGPAAAREDPRVTVLPGDLDMDGLAGPHGPGQAQPAYRLVLAVMAFQFPPIQASAQQAAITPGARVRGLRQAVPPQLAPALLHEEALGALEGIEIEMQRQFLRGGRARVPQGQRLLALQRLVFKVQRGFNAVVGDARRLRLLKPLFRRPSPRHPREQSHRGEPHQQSHHTAIHPTSRAWNEHTNTHSRCVLALPPFPATLESLPRGGAVR